MAPAPPLGDDAVSQTYPTSKGMNSTPPAAMTSTASRPPPASTTHPGVREQAPGVLGQRPTPPHPPEMPSARLTPPQRTTATHAAHQHRNQDQGQHPHLEAASKPQRHPQHHHDALRQPHLTHHELGQHTHEHTPSPARPTTTTHTRAHKQATTSSVQRTTKRTTHQHTLHLEHAPTRRQPAQRGRIPRGPIFTYRYAS